jgi:hypothetical protein
MKTVLRSNNCDHGVVGSDSMWSSLDTFVDEYRRTGHLLTMIESYCCAPGTVLHDCQWRGSLPDCSVANWEKDEISVTVDPIGNHAFMCSCKSFI